MNRSVSGNVFHCPTVTDRFQVKHLHATVLNQVGLDPNPLSYFYISTTA